MKVLCFFVLALALVGSEGNAALSMHKALLYNKVYKTDEIRSLSLNKLHEDDWQVFVEWSDKHNRQPYSSKEEDDMRYQIFAAHRELVELHQMKKLSWKMELNKFSDMTFDEFAARHLMAPQNCSATRFNYVMSGAPAPEHKDWRNEGNYVTPVKNQGKCGSCWSFSTTGCLESATAIHAPHHPLYSLSEQQLVDCAQAFDDHGCSGGLPSHAFEYVRFNKGLMAEEDYPYKAKDGTCVYQASEAVAFVSQVVNITRGSESEILDAVAFKNPVSVAFQVTAGFHDYKSGVYSNPSCGDLPTEVNHAVLVVGYGVDKESGMKYWLIKNSWGADWGMNGYFMMERDVNMCGVAECASYPIV